MNVRVFGAASWVLVACGCLAAATSCGAGPASDRDAQSDAAPRGDAPAPTSDAPADAPPGALPGYGAPCTPADGTESNCPAGMGLHCVHPPTAADNAGICSPVCTRAVAGGVMGDDAVCAAAYARTGGQPACNMTANGTFYCGINCPDDTCPSGLRCVNYMNMGIRVCTP